MLKIQQKEKYITKHSPTIVLAQTQQKNKQVSLQLPAQTYQNSTISF
jgi:hypothetical protein